MYQINMLYTLKLHNVICQTYFNWKKKEFTDSKNKTPRSFPLSLSQFVPYLSYLAAN